MTHLHRLSVLLCALASLLLVNPLTADAPALKKVEPTKFIRVTRDDKDQPLALETSITRYVPANGAGVTVDLVGVVHVGDRAYYDKLNKHMEQYDVLLYELVAPQGTRIPKGGRRETDNPLALLQQVMKTVLALESQTDRIDYTAKNFVHADLSPEEMAEAVRNRGDDGFTLALSIAADFMRMSNLQQQKQAKHPPRAEPEFDPLELLLDPSGPVKLKRMMAQQMEDMGSADAGLGQTLNTILIADRNKAAMQVFQKELAKGKKKIGIFYGAAHMPDFEKRLREDFGLKKDSEQWLPAWDLRLRR
jgi:hypothetical protein